MKTLGKPVGRKHKLREKKKRKQHVALIVAAAVLIGVLSVAGFYVSAMLSKPSLAQLASSSSQPRAAIVDQLSLTFPNETFVETARETLRQAGYNVDYFPGENVTVEFYRNLPTLDYNIIMLRVHSALGSNMERPLALFTSEPYSTTKYVGEQLSDELVEVTYDTQSSGSPSYFGIWPDFIRNGMNGRFQKSVIFLMGCNGMTYTDMAEAFIDRGAGVYIGWFGPVQASHTDSATERVLQSFLIGRRTLKESIQKMFMEIGADPAYRSLLIYYPSEAENRTIYEILGSTS